MPAVGERRSLPGLGRDRQALQELAPGVRRLGVQLVLWKNPDVWVERWLVDSRQGGLAYVVAKSATGAWACSCPRWVYHRERCFHQQRVQLLLGGTSA